MEEQHPIRPLQQQRRRPLPIGGGLGGEDEESTCADQGTAQVVWGVMAEDFEVVGMTVGEVRRDFQGPYLIAPEAEAILNGARADGDVRMADGDVLEFVRPAGEKGAVACR